MTIHDLLARWVAVLVMCHATLEGMSEADAVSLFEMLYNDRAHMFKNTIEHQVAVSDVRGFLQRHYQKWVRTGDVLDGTRTGRPRKVTQEDALRMTVYFKAGFFECVPFTGGYMLLGHRYFTSIEDAVKNCSAIRNFIKDKGCSPRTLFNAMMKFDPDLVRHSIDYKPAYTELQSNARIDAAHVLLEKYQHHLKNVTWIDCASYVLGFDTSSAPVYMSRGHAAFAVTQPLGTTKPGRPVKVAWIMAVNARFGPVYVEMVTGTTALERAGDWQPADKREHSYLVSTMGSWHDAGSHARKPTCAASACPYEVSPTMLCVTRMLLNAGLSTSSGAASRPVCKPLSTHCINSQQAWGALTKST